MTRPGFYQWRNLPTIMPRMRVLVTSLSSWTVATTFECRTRKISTPASSPSWRTSCQRNSKSWWLFVKKISTMPRSFRNGLIIKESNPETIPPARKFGWTANISRPSGSRSWRQSSLGRSECSILSESKLTS